MKRLKRTGFANPYIIARMRVLQRVLPPRLAWTTARRDYLYQLSRAIQVSSAKEVATHIGRSTQAVYHSAGVYTEEQSEVLPIEAYLNNENNTLLHDLAHQLNSPQYFQKVGMR